MQWATRYHLLEASLIAYGRTVYSDTPSEVYFLYLILIVQHSSIASIIAVRCLCPEGMSSTDTLPESRSLLSERMLLTVNVFISQADAALSSVTSSVYRMKYLFVLLLHSMLMPNISITASLWLLNVRLG